MPCSQIKANWHLAVQLLEAIRAFLHALRATDVAGCLLHSGTAAGIQGAMPPGPPAVRRDLIRPADTLPISR